MSAASLRSSVRSAYRRARLMRGVEHALAGGAAASLALAAAAFSGNAEASAGALAVAALCGALAFWTLELERRDSPAEFARQLDFEASAGGALATAVECEADASSSPVARLHAQRVAARYSADDLRACVPLPSPAFAALFLCGAALASLAHERSPAPGTSSGPALASAQRRAPIQAGIPEDGARQGETEARAQSASAAAAGAVPSAGEAVPETESSLQLHEPAAAGGAEPTTSAASAQGDPSSGAAAGSGGDARGSSSANADASPSSQARALTPTSGESTMSGPPPETGMPPTLHADPRSTGAPHAAAPIGRWWPRRHDAVVALYVERTRAALAGAGAGPR